MANTNSSQITAMNAGTYIGSNESHGRQRIAYFSVAAVPTAGTGDTMTLCKLPKGARVVGGEFVFSVAQGATATTAIGISGSTGKYRAAAVTNATTKFTDIANTSATYGLQTSAEETVIATNAAAAWTAALFAGHIKYVVD